MDFIKKNFRAVLVAIALILAGILILANHENFHRASLSVLGVFLIIVSLVYVVRYFKMPPKEAALSQTFFIGLIALAIGCLCSFKPEWLEKAFPNKIVVYGVFQALLGFLKTQKTVDMIRQKQPLWIMSLLHALLFIVFGGVIMINSIANWTLTGVSIIVEGAFGILVVFVESFAAKKSAKISSLKETEKSKEKK